MNPQAGGAFLAPPGNLSVQENVSRNDKVMETENRGMKKVNKYKENSLGPFSVIVQGRQEDNLGNYHPMAIAREILKTNIPHIKGPLRKGRNRISIEFDSPQAANKFLDNDDLKSKGFEMFIPSINVSCRAVIRGIYKNIPIDEIKCNSDSPCEILEVRRLMRRVTIEDKTEFVPTGSCLFTFEGKMVPNAIRIFGIEMKTELYILRVIQCYNCLLYGHVKSQCRGKAKCQNCSRTHEGECRFPMFCMHCKSSSHKTIDRDSCPEFQRQKQIRYYMARNGISFQEANQFIAPIRQNIDVHPQNEREFPRLNARKEENTAPEVGSSKSFLTYSIGKNQAPTYSRITSYKRQKTRSPSPQPGFSREETRDCLFWPESRTKSTPLFSCSPSSSQTGKTPQVRFNQYYEERQSSVYGEKYGLNQSQWRDIEKYIEKYIEGVKNSSRLGKGSLSQDKEKVGGGYLTYPSK